MSSVKGAICLFLLLISAAWVYASIRPDHEFIKVEPVIPSPKPSTFVPPGFLAENDIFRLAREVTESLPPTATELIPLRKTQNAMATQQAHDVQCWDDYSSTDGFKENYAQFITEGPKGILWFAGEWLDSSTDLTYLRARWYDSLTGRFVTKDTWEGDYEQPASLNDWLYSWSNPINYLDPTGFEPGCSGGNCGPDLTEWFRTEMIIHSLYGSTVRGSRQALFDRGFKLAINAVNKCSGATVFDLVQGIYPFDQVVSRVGDGSASLLIGDKAPPPGGLIGGELYVWSLIESLQVVEYALYGLAVDYSNLTYPSIGSCPSSNCVGLNVGDNWHPFITMCGKCHDASDLGNMMFGLGGVTRGLPLVFTYPSATLFNVMNDWIPGLGAGGPNLFESVFSPDAKGAIVGWWLGNNHAFESTDSFCSDITDLDFIGYRDNADQTDQCTPCNLAGTSFAYGPNTFQSVSGIDTVSWLKSLLRLGN
jgi:RHS repeat-associated protein